MEKIDYLALTHYHNDHYNAAAELVKKIPVANFVDHGPNVEANRDDEWWIARRAPWHIRGKGKLYDEGFATYTKAREQRGHIVVKAGDEIPIKGLTVQVLAAGGEVIPEPLENAGSAISECNAFEPRAHDDAEDAQSISAASSKDHGI